MANWSLQKKPAIKLRLQCTRQDRRAKGGKALKVRWAYPGCGESGSLRLVVVAYCDERRVHIAQAFDRRDNPADEDVEDAVSDL